MNYSVKILSTLFLLAGVELVADYALLPAVTLPDGDGVRKDNVVYIPKPVEPAVKHISVQHGLIAAEEDLSEVDNWSDANVSCDSLNIRGYKDWYLPDKDELNKLFISKQALGGFSETKYWNSTQNDDQNAWSQDFSAGKQDILKKENILRVRPVRKF